MMEHILDNPIYNALISAHSIFSRGTDDVKYYLEDVASFAGLKDNSRYDFETLYENSPKESLFIVFTPDPINIPDQWRIVTHIDMFQMIYESKKVPGGAYIDFRDLDESHVPEMTALVELTKPGPFNSRTIELGNYTGVFNGKDLIAMAGHRFNPTPFTEISAVCTHPDYFGKGYAYELICEQIRRILAKSETPFLHVRNDNHGAVKLYKKLGFYIRTEMIVYVIKKS
ncbi:GNAT family N-acetyltransferase [Pedobacter sp. B4-66]|uniref:GNAT family N-acetyltransferase n=1 Tax=Pedobacter sp. B4-66 TaxID=2817280 RepID=UPI001BDB3DB8|nr:GNAT family N-acetyltransferase [Pedobacter sp. B4-66]